MIRRLVAATLVLAVLVPAASAETDFAKAIAPILADRCLSCHNEQISEGDLSLADPTSLIEMGFVIPGDARASRLVDVVTIQDGMHEMPKDAAPLPSDQVAVIRAWIQAGADVPEGILLKRSAISDLNWWSLKPIVPVEVPPDMHPVDWLVDRELKSRGLTPIAQADPAILVRRLHYDLTGLPPTPKAIQKFVAQFHISPESTWNELVDRLLASEEFGEKWGQHWLDVARYAETHGYDKDKPRNNAWPYRDYVIESFNTDKPYDEFVREQVAGDVLADDPSVGIVATGFLAAGPWDFIGHVEVGEGKLDGRIAKHLDRDEIAAAVFNVFQSTTIQCAQCHDHKFDPILSEDYYRVHAVFAAIDRSDRIYAGLSPEQIKRKRELESQRSGVNRLKARAERELRAAVAAEAKEIDPRIEQLEARVERDPPSRHGFHSTIASEAQTTKWVQIDLGRAIDLDRIELIACYDEYNNIGEGFGFPVRFRVETAEGETFEKDSTILMDRTDKDFPNPRSRPVIIDAGGKRARWIRVTANVLAHRNDDYILALAELRVVTPEGQNVALDKPVSASDAIGSNARWSPAFLVDGAFMKQSLNDPEMDELDELRAKRGEIEQSKKTPAFKARMRHWNKQLSRVREELAAIPAGRLVYTVSTDFKSSGQFRPTGGNPRPIHFLHRGDLTARGKRLLPGAPRLWERSPKDFATSASYRETEVRAALADYLTRDDNPLTWRSMANRVFQWTFGAPLVATPNDFGRMGMQPSNPALLDYLAIRLRDDPNRSIKSLVRMLVTSKAYQRASVSSAKSPSSANQAIDSGNEFLWRFNRRRLTAEEIRDTILSASGTLRMERGGPSFLDFVIDRPAHSPHYEYDRYDPADVKTHRRSIYRFVVRSQPNPLLMTLDCADPSVSVARRDESTTALQALAQWNHRLIEYHSRRFASRLGDSPLDEACLLAWGRLPTDQERVILATLHQDHGLETVCRVLLNANAMVYID